MILTLFTPAYNRAETLPRLYESLLKQTCFRFEWLIIDDGSKDRTAQVVQKFTGEGKFPVRYVYKENGGKHTAHNRALQEAAGEWFMCVDSDDTLTADAVERIMEVAQRETNINGIVSYKTDLAGNLLGDAFPQGVKRSKFYELELRYGCHGEYALAFPTQFARNYPFPVFGKERFVGECVVYDRMDGAGEMYLLDVVTMPCEYQPEGYSQDFSRLMRQNPTGFCLYFLQRIDLMPTWMGRLKIAGRYQCFRLISGEKTLRYQGEHKGFVALSFLVGIVFRVYYKLCRRI